VLWVSQDFFTKEASNRIMSQELVCLHNQNLYWEEKVMKTILRGRMLWHRHYLALRIWLKKAVLEKWLPGAGKWSLGARKWRLSLPLSLPPALPLPLPPMRFNRSACVSAALSIIHALQVSID
jgi:hypothetical protein